VDVDSKWKGREGRPAALPAVLVVKTKTVGTAKRKGGTVGCQFRDKKGERDKRE